ncbi:MAG: motility protein A [Candidatus Latescibacterota bacterium]|nr:motility protein A [Candidatus Latescibacterota bacterium]
MDIATIVGMIAAATCLMVGIGSNLPAMIDPPSMIIVVGGTVAGALIANPLAEVINIVGVYKNAILTSVSSPTELIERIVGFAETARREGILALEQAIEEGDDPFLSTGIRLAVDGTEPDLIQDVLETELAFVEERHKLGQDMVANMGDSAPAFGMIGTLIGLVIMLKNMDDPAAIGPGMAIALLTTMYGAILANILFGPVAMKLKTYSSKEQLAKRMIIEGIMAIQSGDNPRIVEHKLSVFLSPKFRPSGEEGEREAA